MITPHEQMREALQVIETVMNDAYHRHFAECCGRGREQGCCGDFIEQWTPEDHKILDTLSPIQRQLSQALAATPVKESFTPEPEQPTELEMHRADYQDCKAAGFESPGELLSAYKTLLARTAEPAPTVRLTEKQIIKAWNKAHKKSGNHRSYQFDIDFANAIIDAFIAKNGGKV